jgi:polyisoprenoid-binding protein YceI
MATLITPFTGTWIVDTVHSSIGFGVKHMGTSTFRAAFDKVEGRVVASDDGIELTGTAEVESITITSPQEFRDHVVYGDDFFDAKNHPTISARATDVEFRDDGTVELRGELTLRGVTKQVTATGTYSGPTETPFGSTVAAIELSATVDRRDFGLAWQMELPAGGDALATDVELTATLELEKEA